jgi:hypothetical protein
MKKTKFHDCSSNTKLLSPLLLKVQLTGTGELVEILRAAKDVHTRYGEERRCCSGRRQSRCQRCEQALMCTRIHEAISRAEYEPNGWVFVVLTPARCPVYVNRKKSNRDRRPSFRIGETYDALSRMTRKLLRRVNLRCERNTWRAPKSDWVAAIDVDRGGWPRIKLILYSPDFAAALETERRRVRAQEAGKIRTMRRAGVSSAEAQQAVQAAKLKSRALFGELLECASTVKWGAQSTAEQVRDARLTRCAANLADDSMRPSARPLADAGVRFRRVRAGVCFLPQRSTSAHIEFKRFRK